MERKADMLYPRADHGLCLLNSYIYAIGSFMHNQCNISCERYDSLQNVWTPIANLNIGRAGSAVCSFDNEFIYCFGGRNGQQQIIPEIEVYSVNSDKWMLLPIDISQMNLGWIPGYMALAHQITESEIIVFGGKSLNVVTKEAYVFNTETFSFSKGPALRNPSSFMNFLVTHGTHFYAFGNDNYIHRFSLTDQTWTIKNKNQTGTSQEWF